MDATILNKNRKSLGRQTLSRRDWIIASTAAAACLALPSAANAQSGSKSTQPKVDEDTGLFRIRAVLEVNGEIRLKSQSTDALSKSGKTLAAKTAPIKATSTVEFDEQFETTAQLIGCRSYQHFHEANSEIQIDRHVTKTNLRENCLDIVRLGTNEGLVTASPDNPLFAAERDLIEGPINTMFLDQILTDVEVNIADKWTIDNDVACRLLNMDAIHDGKLVVCLVDANKEKAQLEINGSISASVRQVPTTITIEGKAQLDRTSGTISWLAMNLDETRDISEAEPGFHVVAQLKILRSKIESMTSGLTLNDVASRVGNLDSASLLQFQSDQGYYRFIANRKWSTYRDSGEEATLRYIVNNRVVCQCNVTNMIDYEPGRQLSLEGFQADVRISVGRALLEIVESSERISANKLRLLRVVSRGSVQGVDIQWVHYHISNDNGRRVVLTFTLNEANLEIFAEEDAQLAGSFELIDWPTKLDAKSVESAAAADNATEGSKSLIVPNTKTSSQPIRPKMAR